jgi:hypothetical protein
MAIASTSNGHNVQPPPGPAEAPARTTASELTDEQRGWLSEASRSDINGWLHVTIKGSPAARGFQYGFLVAEVGKRMLGDTFDTYLGYVHPSSRTICAHSDVDPCFDSGLTPFTPFGSVDGKVVNSADIKTLSLWAVSGRADGTEFDAEEFLRQHPQWDWQRGYLKDRPQQPWTHVEPGSTSGP